MLSDEWLPRYRLLENFTAKWNGNGNGNGNAYDRGDYNSSFALRAVELKTERARVLTRCYPILALWELSVAIEIRVPIRCGPKPNAAFPSPL